HSGLGGQRNQGAQVAVLEEMADVENHVAVGVDSPLAPQLEPLTCPRRSEAGSIRTAPYQLRPDAGTLRFLTGSLSGEEQEVWRPSASVTSCAQMSEPSSSCSAGSSSTSASSGAWPGVDVPPFKAASTAGTSARRSRPAEHCPATPPTDVRMLPPSCSCTYMG